MRRPPRVRFAALLPVLALSLPAIAMAGDPPQDPSIGAADDPDASPQVGYHPYYQPTRVRTVDLRPEARARNPGQYIAQPVEQPDFWSLDEIAAAQAEQPRAAQEPGALPDGWVQKGNVVLPEAVANGGFEVEPETLRNVNLIPGNDYPRQHSLFLNFGGGMLYPGADNSAENRSNLAKQGVYPAFGGGEQTALAIVQAVQADVAPYNMRIFYDRRPRNVVPYTMEMMGGDWTDTNIDSPAGGVAPGADCGALGQRHVVYTFTNGGSVTGAANTASQEAGHAWGLDHSLNSGSVMSYSAFGDASFVEGCNTLCEAQCQGEGSIGCRLTHEMFCGEDSEQQDDHAEMSWLFGDGSPDMEAPTVEIQEPADGAEIEAGGEVKLRAVVDDDFGGYGWKFVVKKDGEIVYDQPDYDREVDAEYRAALNLTQLDAGVWELTVEAEDQWEHVTTQTVTVYVGGATDGGGSDAGDESGGTDDAADDDFGDDSGGDGNDDDPEDGGSDEEGSDGADGGANATEDAGGCACSTTEDRPGWAGLALLGLLGLRMRRSTRAMLVR